MSHEFRPYTPVVKVLGINVGATPLQTPAEYLLKFTKYLHQNAWSIVFLIAGGYILKTSGMSLPAGFFICTSRMFVPVPRVSTSNDWIRPKVKHLALVGGLRLQLPSLWLSFVDVATKGISILDRVLSVLSF
mmetsp:Transcript_40283/g.121326  ORF Transcript_40283/g.121326 Transcript_40283/m.121326 type:complete len:132 (+) Transcript_40283:224-619(+)